MSPALELWNLKPSSTDCGSFTDIMLGVGLELNRLTVEDDEGLTVRLTEALAVPPRPSEMA